MNKYAYYLDQMKNKLPLGESFDVLERKFSIGDRDATMFFVDGLVKGDVMQMVMADLISITADDMKRSKTSQEFLKYNLPYLDSLTESDVDKAIKHFYAGLIPILIDGFDEIIIIDIREYPVRSVEEPSKEKTLRGAKDGFNENLMTNIALIRRRIRDNRLIFKNFVVGDTTKTDVCMVYMKGVAREKIVSEIDRRISALKVDALTVGEQSLVEALLRQSGRSSNDKGSKVGRSKDSWFNPYPKVRYTQRPDIIAAHVSEGKVAVIVDNTPTVILIPTGLFDFTQDADDYYFPMITGNYFRLLRFLNLLVIMFLTPAYLLISEGYMPAPAAIEFFIPEEKFAIPLFWQFLLLEIAIDGLKLASLNTPESLGMSLSVIGALILGEFSVSSGWFIPQTILCMAVVALASFTQPSIELGYGIKFSRVLILIGVAVAGFWGAAAGLLISLVVLFTTRNLVGEPYLYPLIPFNGKALKRLIFRTRGGKEA